MHGAARGQNITRKKNKITNMANEQKPSENHCVVVVGVDFFLVKFYFIFVRLVFVFRRLTIELDNLKNGLIKDEKHYQII